MGKLLDRLFKGELQTSDTATKAAVIPTPPPRPALPPQPRAPLTNPEAQKSILRARCARFDKPYEIHYERQTDGSFRFVESVKVSDAAGSSSGGGSSRGAASGIRAPLTETIPIEQLDRHSCPWCGSDDINGPCLCGSLICGGETEESNGTVRVSHLGSCGRTWPGIPMREIQTEEQTKPRGGPQTPARAPALPPALPASARATLPAATSGRTLIIRGS